MSALNDEGIPNLRASYTVDEAVARLIGWLRSPISRKYIQVTEHGVSADQMVHMAKLEWSLDEALNDQRESARAALQAARQRGARASTRAKLVTQLNEAEELIGKARAYRQDLVDAINRESDVFIVDREETKRSGLTHYTARSLDDWASSKYGRQCSSHDLATVDVLASESTDAGSQDAGDSKLPMSKTALASLLVTFAVVVEDLSEQLTGLQAGGRPNAKAIAERVVKRLTSRPHGPAAGQGSEAVRKRIGAALKELDKYLRGP